MRFRSNNRGQIRVLEAFFASVLMLSSLTLIPVVQNALSPNKTVSSSTAMNLLITLDSEGQLATLIDARNWSGIQSMLESVIPPALWFNFTVYDANANCLNSTPISSGTIISYDIEAANYLCPSISGNYVIYNVRLQLAGLS